MSGFRIEIERLHISVEGVPQTTLEQAIADLPHELQVRLGRTRWTSDRQTPLEVDRVTVRERIGSVDAATLRSIIAENLVEEIRRAARGREEEE